MIDCILVDEPVLFAFDGAISRSEAAAVWTWITRDLAPDLIAADAPEEDPATIAALEAITPEILSRARAAVDAAGADPETATRLKTRLGDGVSERLPLILNALKCHPLLRKAQAYGRALNGIQEDAALAAALQSIPCRIRVSPRFC